MPRDKGQKRDLHALNEGGMVLCNPRDAGGRELTWPNPALHRTGANSIEPSHAVPAPATGDVSEAGYLRSERFAVRSVDGGESDGDDSARNPRRRCR